MAAPNQPEEIEIEFREGLPVGMNGKRMSSVALIEQLNTQAGKHGIGRKDTVEDRVIGFKSREVYEAPAATTLYSAKRALEQICLSRETLQVREGLATAYGRVVYNGQWFSDLREALDSFYDRINKNVSGKVTLRLYKGLATIVARSSEYSLLSSVPRDQINNETAAGFIKLWNLPLAAEAKRKKK
jgi:argininosuccinate synthase